MGRKNNFFYIIEILKNGLNITEKEFYHIWGNFLLEKFLNSNYKKFSELLENLTSGDIPLNLRPDQPNNLIDFSKSKNNKEKDETEEVRIALSTSAF